MLQRFFGSEEKPLSKTRFEKTLEAKPIIAFIEKINIKENELKKSADKLGQGSVAYAKHYVISSLLRQINNSIKNYNQKIEPLDSDSKMKNFIDLLREFEWHVDGIMAHPQHRFTLEEFRDNKKQVTKTVVDGSGLLGVASACAIFGVIGGVAAYAMNSGISSVIEQNSEVYIPKTGTLILLEDFKKLLSLTIRNLNLALNTKETKEAKPLLSDDDNMRCPITKALMEHPVFCTIDGHSYEKSAIKEWLEKNRKSPMTREKLPDGARVEDVLKPNRSLKCIIDNYRAKLPIEKVPARPPEMKV